MEAFFISALAAALDPVRWIVGLLLGWFSPSRWGAAISAAAASVLLGIALTPHVNGAAVLAGTVVTGGIALGLGTWRQRRRQAKGRLPLPAASSAPLDPTRLTARSAEENRQHLLAATGLIAPVKIVVRDALSPLGATGLFEVDIDVMTNDIVGHLLAFHSALVLERPQPVPLAAFAMGQAVAKVFDAAHEDSQQRACVVALAEVLKHAMGKAWSPADIQLLESAAQTLNDRNNSPSRFNLGPAFE